MTDREIIKKAIEKAVSNGYKVPTFIDIEASWAEFLFVSRKIYFSHDFAKAFFGEEPFEGFKTFHDGNGNRITYRPCYEMLDNPSKAKRDDAAWKAHLQQMVLEENPIDYLRKFI